MKKMCAPFVTGLLANYLVEITPFVTSMRNFLLLSEGL